MSKQTVSILIIPFIIITVFSCNKDYNNKAVVLFSIGEVSITGNDNRNRPVQPADILQEGDTIVTGNNGQLTIQLGQEALIKITKNSKVLFNRILDRSEPSFTMIHGTVLSRVKKLSKDRGLIIKTPTTVASVRGTVFGVFYNRGTARVAVSNGKVEVVTRSATSLNKDPVIIGSNTTAVIMHRLETRRISDIEELETEKISSTQFLTGEELNDRDSLQKGMEESKMRDDRIDKKIKQLENKPVSMSYDEIQKNTGVLTG